MFQSRIAKVIWASTRPKNCFEHGNCAVTVGDDNPITHVYSLGSPVRVGVFQSAKPIETRDFGGAIPKLSDLTGTSVFVGGKRWAQVERLSAV